MHATHADRPDHRPAHGEWGPSHHRDLDDGLEAVRAVQTGLDLRDHGGPRPDDN